jgi:tRNA A37 threonylcarbamoyladenosine biosynthesis protein TsaE
MFYLMIVAVARNIVTDLIKALPDNGSVNSPTYTGGQQYSGGVL